MKKLIFLTVILAALSFTPAAQADLFCDEIEWVAMTTMVDRQAGVSFQQALENLPNQLLMTPKTAIMIIEVAYDKPIERNCGNKIKSVKSFQHFMRKICTD